MLMLSKPYAVGSPVVIEALESRRHFASTYDIAGVQAASLDQPQVHAIFRTSPTGNPLGGNNPNDGIAIKAFLDTGASGVLLSLESAQGLGLAPITHNGQPVTFYDVGVAGSEAFGVSRQLYGALAPVRSVFDGDLPVEAFDQTFGAFRAQMTPHPADVLLGGPIDLIGMPAMKGKVVVMDPTPLNAADIDGMRTYLYAPNTPYNASARNVNPGIPSVNRHVKLSYGNFARFTEIEPAGAPAPTITDNPFIGPNPVRTSGPADNTPGIAMTEGARATAGSFLLDTGAAASFVSRSVAQNLGVRYRAGTYGTDNPVLEDANGVRVPNQFTIPIGGIGGTVTAAGFRIDKFDIPTTEGEAIRFLDAPVLVLDVSVQDPVTSQQVTLEGVFGMNFLVASFAVDGTTLGESAAGAFDWVTFDEPNGVLGLNLPGAGPVSPPPVPPPAAVGSVSVASGTVQRSMVKSLTIAFDRPVATFDAGAFTLTRRDGAGGVAVPLAAAVAADGLSVVLTFPGTAATGGSLADGTYDLLVRPALVRDAAGQSATGANRTIAFHRLFSDADGDGDSDNADLFQFRAAYGKFAADPGSGYRVEFDYDGDGDVDAADLFQVRARRAIEYKGY